LEVLQRYFALEITPFARVKAKDLNLGWRRREKEAASCE
jgi:hypothetical protein